MKSSDPIERGDIVQLAPEKDKMFGACFMVVTEVKGWGCQGYVQAIGNRDQIGGLAYYRAPWDQMKPTGGKVVWWRETPE